MRPSKRPDRFVRAVLAVTETAAKPAKLAKPPAPTICSLDFIQPHAAAEARDRVVVLAITGRHRTASCDVYWPPDAIPLAATRGQRPLNLLKSLNRTRVARSETAVLIDGPLPVTTTSAPCSREVEVKAAFAGPLPT